MAGSGSGFDIQTDQAADAVTVLNTQWTQLQDLLQQVEQKRQALMADGFIGQSAQAFGEANVRWQQGQNQMNEALNSLKATLSQNIQSYQESDAQGRSFFHV
jgi:WXG100 family type VII secretion target